MQNKFSTYQVLIADDSKLVCSTINSLLKGMGFHQDHLYTIYKPSDLIAKCTEIKFDLIICDYNFNANINGHQLFSEIKNSGTFKSTSTFIFLTGENDAKIVRSILDAEPDDYILKPFTKPHLAKRIICAINRKNDLKEIFFALSNNDYNSAIFQCDRLLPLLPKHSSLIKKIKSETYVKQGQYKKAQAEYETMLRNDDSDWIKTALANVYIEQDKLTKAKSILRQVKTQKTNPYYHDGMSTVNIINNDIPKAISHLKSSVLLLDSGLERELVIANLSLANNAPKDAYRFAKRYYKNNYGTFRSTDLTMLIYVRYYLITMSKNNQGQLKTISPELNQLKKASSLNLHEQIIRASIDLQDGQIKSSWNRLKTITDNKNNFSKLDFYACYFLSLLLQKFSMMHQLKHTLIACEHHIDKKNIHIKHSQIYLLKKLEKQLQDDEGKLTTFLEDLHQMHKDDEHFSDIIDKLFEIQSIQPYSTKISNAIIHIMAHSNSNYQGKYLVKEKLNQSVQTLLELSHDKTKSGSEIMQKYTKALKKLETTKRIKA